MARNIFASFACRNTGAYMQGVPSNCRLPSRHTPQLSHPRKQSVSPEKGTRLPALITSRAMLSRYPQSSALSLANMFRGTARKQGIVPKRPKHLALSSLVYPSPITSLRRDRKRSRKIVEQEREI